MFICIFAASMLKCFKYSYIISTYFLFCLSFRNIYIIYILFIHPHKLPICNLLMVTFPTNHIAQKHILNNCFKYADIAIDV